MLNRRHLRIKILQALYAYFQSSEETPKRTEGEMLTAIERIYDLYLYLLLTFADVKKFAESRLEDSKKKIIPSEEEINPNRKFVDNKLIAQLEASSELRGISEDLKVNWLGDENQEMFRKMFKHLRDSETYFEHMNNDQDSYESDRAFLLDLFKVEIVNFPLLYNFFEETSIHWLDDIDLAAQMVVKTLKNMSEKDGLSVLTLHKDSVDEKQFVLSLFRKTIEFNKENELLIDELTANWELDRIAKMDVILMKMAITELQIFENIPTKVTLNEYIEISKFYSTPKSNGFINGILDKAIQRLEKENKIKKVGRGLVN